MLDDKLTFEPLYTHQVFGEKEAIFGYKGLKIQVFAGMQTSLRGLLYSVYSNVCGL